MPDLAATGRMAAFQAIAGAICCAMRRQPDRHFRILAHPSGFEPETFAFGGATETYPIYAR